MKKVLFIATLISGIVVTTAFKTSKTVNPSKNEVILADKYCEGWADGYCEGWKDVKGTYAICPITPICPIAELGKETFKDGYNRGFKAGSRAAQK